MRGTGSPLPVHRYQLCCDVFIDLSEHLPPCLGSVAIQAAPAGLGHEELMDVPREGAVSVLSILFAFCS